MPDPKPPLEEQLKDFKRRALASLSLAFQDASGPPTREEISEHMWQAALQAQLPGMSTEAIAQAKAAAKEQESRWRTDLERIFKTTQAEFPGGFADPEFQTAIRERLRVWTATLFGPDAS